MSNSDAIFILKKRMYCICCIKSAFVTRSMLKKQYYQIQQMKKVSVAHFQICDVKLVDANTHAPSPQRCRLFGMFT